MKREQRLRKNNDFRALYREGLKVRLPGLVLYCRPFASGMHRMGIVISRKMGGAVVRNRFKRRMRTFFELFTEKIPMPSDLVWIATQLQTAQRSFSELQRQAKEGLERLRRKLEIELRKRANTEAASGRGEPEA